MRRRLRPSLSGQGNRSPVRVVLPGAAKRLCKTDQLVRELVNPFPDFLVLELAAFERAAGGVNETRDNHTAKIEHQTAGEGHHRHVAAHSSRRAKKPNDLVFPGTSG